MKLFFQGLFAFEAIMMVATFVSHMIVIVITKNKVPLKIYGIVFIITIIMYELFVIGMM